MALPRAPGRGTGALGLLEARLAGSDAARPGCRLRGRRDDLDPLRPCVGTRPDHPVDPERAGAVGRRRSGSATAGQEDEAPPRVRAGPDRLPRLGRAQRQRRPRPRGPAQDRHEHRGTRRRSDRRDPPPGEPGIRARMGLPLGRRRPGDPAPGPRGRRAPRDRAALLGPRDQDQPRPESGRDPRLLRRGGRPRGGDHARRQPADADPLLAADQARARLHPGLGGAADDPAGDADRCAGDQAHLPGPGLLHAGADRPRRASVPPLQVQDDGRRRRGARGGAAGREQSPRLAAARARPAGDQGGPPASPDQHRRAAAAGQRDQGRHEPGRAAPDAPRGGRADRRLGAPPTRPDPGDNRSLAGPRAGPAFPSRR